MKIRIERSAALGTAVVPASKSLLHRYLICAALADGESTIRGVTISEDVSATIDCIRMLGADVKADGNTLKIFGSAGKIHASDVLKCRESASTLRFLIPVVLLDSEKTVFEGSKTLLSRPMDEYATMCAQRGLLFERGSGRIAVCGSLKSGAFTVNGDVSSQFVSGLLFALPLLDGDGEINIVPPVTSRPYIDMTLAALRKFRVRASWRDETTLFVRGGQKFIPADVTCEGDWSAAANLLALNALGGDVVVKGLYSDSLQGDSICIKYFEELSSGCPTLCMSDCPDLAPVMFAVAAAKKGAVFTSTDRLRCKESDRVEVMTRELSKFGVKSEISENRVAIFASPLHTPDVPLCTHNDHRIAMALSLLLMLTGGELDGAEAVEKSFPAFFDTLKSLGVSIRKKEDFVR